MITEVAKAKVNLDLLVLARRPDGYHELDSLVVFAELQDRLSFAPAGELALAITGPMAARVPAGGDNLVLRAALDLAQVAGVRTGAAITLEKHLPVEAGIGGGSADAAAALRGLARLWGLPLTAERLRDIGQGLGADVPVCVYSRPARIRSTGERIDPIRALPEMPMLLVNPGVAVPTREVFKALALPERPEPRPAMQPQASLTRLAVWLADSRNDLMAPALALAPVIGQVLAELEALEHCRLARMSGSGATCFALFPEMADAEAAAARLGAIHPDWWIVATVARGG